MAIAEKPFLPSFGRRKGKSLGVEKRTLLSEAFPQWEVPPLDGKDNIDPAAWFLPSVQRIAMEIGFGSGEFLTRQIHAFPETGFIGCEPYLNGMASFLREVEKAVPDNIRVWKEDARILLTALKPACLDKVFILFPDPWPKKKHHKRRIISHEMLDLLAEKIKPGGELLLATDHVAYAEWMLAHLLVHPAFEWTAKSPKDWKTPPDSWVSTRYENKTRGEGRPPVFLEFLVVSS